MRERVDRSASASSGVVATWHQLDWHRVERNVRGMQVRIAKATREGDWRKVKALQRMLTRTLSAKALAVRRVTENRGKRTAGVDRELWGTRIQVGGDTAVETQGLRTSAVTASVYPQGQWEGAPPGHPDHARQGHAGATPAGLAAGG